jgi:hypothetical protein
LALSGGRIGILMDSHGQLAYNGIQSAKPGNDAANADFPGSGSVCTSGGGPGLQNQLSKSTNLLSSTTSENDAENLAFYLALLAKKSPDLALVVKQWGNLPEAVRAGIIAMVRSVTPVKGG